MQSRTLTAPSADYRWLTVLVAVALLFAAHHASQHHAAQATKFTLADDTAPGDVPKPFRSSWG